MLQDPMPKNPSPLTIWTIGHSTLPLADFRAVLQHHAIGLIIDVRQRPGSRRHPQFDQQTLRTALAEVGIGYAHLPALGGRRAPRAASPNVAWRLAAFRGYADHMDGAEFAAGIAALLQLARGVRAAFMCAEGSWRNCHRGLISDHLKAAGHRVLHLRGLGEPEEHPYTHVARIVAGRLSYRGTAQDDGVQQRIDLDG
jgi:uncharacterized protein (DUF488 family)